MTPEEHAAEIEGTINGAVDGFTGYAETHQRTIYRKIQERVRDLKLNANGTIKPTAANIKEARKLSRDLEGFIKTPKYNREVEILLDELETLRLSLNVFLLDQFGDKFNEGKAVFETIYENTILLTRNTLLQSGLSANVIPGMEKILIDSVTGNMKYRDMLSELRQFVEGNTEYKGMFIGSGKGKLNLKTTLRDGFNQFSANYQQTVSTGLGNEWYLYCCGTVEDSREWCTHRVGKYWHEKEIRDWGDDKWQGRNPNTNESNILVLRGGYNCMHQFIPVSQAIVPKEDIERAKRLGYID